MMSGLHTKEKIKWVEFDEWVNSAVNLKLLPATSSLKQCKNNIKILFTQSKVTVHHRPLIYPEDSLQYLMSNSVIVVFPRAKNNSLKCCSAFKILHISRPEKILKGHGVSQFV